MKNRDSNIELLRMVAMFLVLLVHADYFSLGVPTTDDIINNPVDGFWRIFFEALSIVCVNVFVLISGWFGIRPKLKGISNFLFQCFFFLIGIYIVTLLIGSSSLSLKGIAGCFFATNLNWFIKAYLLLYILSPVLNSFVEHADRKVFRNVLIAFFIFTCTYGWIGAANFMMGGYTTLFFIGLYLLARYIRIYQPQFTLFSIKVDLSIYFGIVIIVTLFSICLPLLTGINYQPWFAYISPTTVLSSLFLFLSFTKMNFQNKFINSCGESCFAVFLIHTNPNTLWHYKDLFINLHSRFSTMRFWVITFIILLLIFFVAILIDKIRICCWNTLWRTYELKKHD